MLTSHTTLRPVSARHTRATAVRPARVPSPCATNCKPLLAVVMRAQTGDDSDAMGQENFEGLRPQEENVFTEQDLKSGNIEGQSGQDTPMKVQDIGQGRMEPNTEGSSQPMGTEYGQATEQRTGSSSGSQGGHENAQMSGAQEMSRAPPTSDEGGRFDEEPIPGNHPYDPRPRERGHGVPPHKDSSNTGPGPSSGQESTPQASQSAPQSSAGETSETTARDEFKQDRM